MRYEETVYLKESFLEMIRKYLTVEPTDPADGLGENEIIRVKVPFQNGYEMDVMCCGVEYEEGESRIAYADAVLFGRDDVEVRRAGFNASSFEGVWELDDWDGNTYVAHIKSETEMEVMDHDS